MSQSGLPGRRPARDTVEDIAMLTSMSGSVETGVQCRA